MSATTPVDLVVGVDFGMTCTGVAYSNTKLPTPRVIQSWPGKHHEVNNKVPSSVVYSSERSTRNMVKCWGFKSQNAEGTKEWFKPYLDPERNTELKGFARKSRAQRGKFGIDGQDETDIPDHDEVKRYYRDYMSCLYTHVSDVIQAKTGYWKSQRVEFVFSLPCTFEKPAIGKTLLTLIKEAGFGRDGERHTVELGLTEPEAAAVFTMKESAVGFEAGTTMLVCDAGGGTTDLAVLHSVTKNEGNPELEALSVVEGRNVGSTNIDKSFERMVEKRISRVTPAPPEDTAWSMMNSSEFQVWKCIFGQDDSIELESFLIPVPTVDSDFSHDKAKIVNGKMLFSQRDFQDLFDPEVHELIKLISAQIESLKRSNRDKKLDFIVLSGGLGSSAYVKSRLKDKFEGGRDQPKLQILVSEEPQLAVVKGLVIDRVQKLRTGKAVLKSRKCRASYGLMLNVPYDKEEHVGQECYRGPDGVTYVRRQIIWFIRKGESIDPERPIIRKARRDFLSSDTRRNMSSTIYMSLNDPQSLPTNTNHADAQYVCRIHFDLTNLGLDKFEIKKSPSKNFLNLQKRKYYRAYCDTKIIIEAADLKIEVWFNGKQYGEEYVSVDWA